MLSRACGFDGLRPSDLLTAVTAIHGNEATSSLPELIIDLSRSICALTNA
jgi:hypothetical protein